MNPKFKNGPDLPSSAGRDCSWVRDNLGAYDLWDDSLSQAEFGDIESHLHHCPACASKYADIRSAREVIQMTLAGVGRNAWEHEKKAIAAEIMARLRESGCFDGEVLDSPTAFSDVGPTPTPRITVGFSKGNRLSRSGHWWRPLALAGSLLLMVALPVLALVGLHKLYIPSLDPESFAPHPKQSVPPEASGAATVPLDTAPAAKSAASPSDSTPVNWDQTSRIALDILTEDALRRVELEALLPATEEEYEVWAREEYPHIMALYDILVEATEDQPNITALWDGTPVHIPDWARRLYVDTPEDKRPMGWRALLIYSGEVFKFDWPTRTTDPNCRPTLEAMQHVASVAGFVLRFAEDGQYGVSFSPHAGIGVDEHRFTLRALEASPSVWVLPSQNPSENYVASALNNHSVAEAALRYLITSSHLVQLPPFESLSLSGTTLLTSSIASPMSKCDVATRASLLNDFFESRRELLEWVVVTSRSGKR